MEGALTTENGKKGWLTDEFIKYGQSLGLGMNWEGDHIDVAVDGTQWDGTTETKNFGGFKYSATKNEFAENVEENDADFTDKQNQMWRLAQYASDRAKTKYGYEVSAELFYKQWVHESGANFDANKTLAAVHNYDGLTQTEANDLPQPDGSNYYRKFNNDTEYADAYIDDFIKHYPEINGVKTEKEFAAVLKKYDYFGDTLENYTRGMEGVAVPKTKMKNPAAISDSENISATATETPAERTPFVDNVIKDLLSDNTPVEFNLESNNHLTQAVYKDFVFDKLHNDTSAEVDLNRKFFSTHSELFDKNGEFDNTPKNRATITEHFGTDEINDFGQKLLEERIAAVGNIQAQKDFTGADLFTTKEFKTKDKAQFFQAKLSQRLPDKTFEAVKNLARSYGGKRDSYRTNAFNFSSVEDRNKFMQEAASYVQNAPVEIQPPKNAKAIESLLAQDDTAFNPYKVNPVTKNIISQFAAQKYQNRNTPEGKAEFKQNFKGMFKDGKFENNAKNRERLAEIYSDELQTFGQNELNNQIAVYQNWQQQAAQSQLTTDINTLQENLKKLQAQIEPARAKVQEAINSGNDKAIAKYGAELSELNKKISAMQGQYSQLQQAAAHSQEIIQPSQVQSAENELPPIQPQKIIPPAQVQPAENELPSVQQQQNIS